MLKILDRRKFLDVLYTILLHCVKFLNEISFVLYEQCTILIMLQEFVQFLSVLLHPHLRYMIIAIHIYISMHLSAVLHVVFIPLSSWSNSFLLHMVPYTCMQGKLCLSCWISHVISKIPSLDFSSISEYILIVLVFHTKFKMTHTCTIIRTHPTTNSSNCQHNCSLSWRRITLQDSLVALLYVVYFHNLSLTNKMCNLGKVILLLVNTKISIFLLKQFIYLVPL